MTVHIDMGRLPGELRQRFAADQQSVVLAVQDAVLRGESRIARSIRETEPFQPVDKGFYAASHDHQVDAEGGWVYSTCPYAAVIEYGARPYVPPIGPLFRWAYRKFRVRLKADYRAGNKAAGRRGSKLGAEEYRTREAMQIARAVQRRIAERGIAPRHVYARALPGMREDVGRALRRLRRMLHPRRRSGSGSAA